MLIESERKEMNAEEVRRYFIDVLESRSFHLEELLEYVEPRLYYLDFPLSKEEKEQYRNGYRDGYLDLLQDILGLMQESDFGM